MGVESKPKTVKQLVKNVGMDKIAELMKKIDKLSVKGKAVYLFRVGRSYPKELKSYLLKHKELLPFLSAETAKLIGLRTLSREGSLDNSVKKVSGMAKKKKSTSKKKTRTNKIRTSVKEVGTADVIFAFPKAGSSIKVVSKRRRQGRGIRIVVKPARRKKSKSKK